MRRGESLVVSPQLTVLTDCSLVVLVFRVARCFVICGEWGNKGGCTMWPYSTNFFSLPRCPEGGICCSPFFVGVHFFSFYFASPNNFSPDQKGQKKKLGKLGLARVQIITQWFTKISRRRPHPNLPPTAHGGTGGSWPFAGLRLPSWTG
jgi:hypothetical protein